MVPRYVEISVCEPNSRRAPAHGEGNFLPQAAAANVRDGRVSIVGVGRATLAQPDWVRQLLEHGQLDRKRVCRTFSYCTALMRAKEHPLGQYPTGCPPFDKEGYGAVWKEVQQLGLKK